MKAMLAALALSFGVAHAGEVEDPIHAAMALHTIDYLQTLSISGSCHQENAIYETNPLLGRCPSKAEVTRYFAISGVAMYALHEALPDRYKRYASYVWVTVEAGAVANNVKVGVRIKF